MSQLVVYVILNLYMVAFQGSVTREGLRWYNGGSLTRVSRFVPSMLWQMSRWLREDESEQMSKTVRDDLLNSAVLYTVQYGKLEMPVAKGFIATALS